MSSPAFGREIETGQSRILPRFAMKVIFKAGSIRQQRLTLRESRRYAVFLGFSQAT